jgi:hypothetical protein
MAKLQRAFILAKIETISVTRTANAYSEPSRELNFHYALE